MPANDRGERMRGPNWDATRKKGIGGSDAAVVMGISPWKTPLELYAEKRGEIEPKDISGKEYVYWGNKLEDTVAREYGRRFGRNVRRAAKTVQHKVYPFMFCNVDRYVQRDASLKLKLILEVKTVSHFAFNPNQWGDDGSSFVPPYYHAQCQHNIECTGSDQCDMPVLIAGNRFACYHIPRDQEFIDKMIAIESTFIEGVKNGIPPEPINLKDLGILFPTSEPGTRVEADVDTMNAWRALCVARGRARESLNDGKLFKLMVMRFMQDNETLTGNGEPLATWKNDKHGKRRFRCFEPNASGESDDELGSL